MRSRISIRGYVRPSVGRSHTSWNHAKVPFLTKTTISTSENASYGCVSGFVRLCANFGASGQIGEQISDTFFTPSVLLHSQSHNEWASKGVVRASERSDDRVVHYWSLNLTTILNPCAVCRFVVYGRHSPSRALSVARRSLSLIYRTKSKKERSKERSKWGLKNGLKRESWGGKKSESKGGSWVLHF